MYYTFFDLFFILQTYFRMADFKKAMFVLLLLCLVSSGMGMSLAGTNLDENSAAARFIRELYKRKAML